MRLLVLPLACALAAAVLAPTTSAQVREPSSVPRAAKAPASPAAASTRRVELPKALVHRSPTCGCCLGWAEHLREAGFAVEVREHDDMTAIKQKLGVPPDKHSCHTAEIGGYVVEGHVPAEDIKRLLAERTRPKARGLTVPGMPIGSPGMEVPDGRVQRYVVERIAADGSTTAYATHGK